MTLYSKVFSRTQYNSGKLQDKGYCLQWLLDHSYLVDIYIHKKHLPEDHDYIASLMLNNPVDSFWVLQDFLKKDDEKINNMYNLLISQSYVNFIIIASPGYGKTSTMCSILSVIKKITNRKLYQLGSEIPSPLFDGVVYDVLDVPKNSDVYVDELAKVWPARDFNSVANKRITDELITLRHKGIKLFGCTQKARLVDKNVIDFANFKIFKYIVNPEFERQEVLNPFTYTLLPKDNRNKSACLFMFEGVVSTFDYHPDPKFFSEFFSKGQAIEIPLEQIQNKAISLYKSGYGIPEIDKRIIRENSVKLSQDFLDSLKSYKIY